MVGIVSALVIVFPQEEQYCPPVCPCFAQVGFIVLLFTGVCICAILYIVLLSIRLHIEHILIFRPNVFSVGCLIIIHSPNVCPNAYIVIGFNSVSLHTEHIFHSVEPFFVHVAGVYGIVFGICPVAGIVS